MERYLFDVLVDMIMTAKMNLPPDRPLHLFGAGHPFMFTLAVALGCDLFDSAAYALYAREGRYMTENGTHRLSELKHFPCTCPRCANTLPDKVLRLSPKEREVFLAEHNLYVCAAEIRRIKQAIRDGRLWEHLELRAHAHPALYTALKKLEKYKDFIEKHTPATKQSGLFFYDAVGLMRPEVVRYRKLLAERYKPQRQAKTLLLVPQPRTKPFHKSFEYKQIRKKLGRKLDRTNVCFYFAPFGIAPIELCEVYPLSQHETAAPVDEATQQYVAVQVADYIKRTRPAAVTLITDTQDWSGRIQETVRKVCRQNHIPLNVKTFESISKNRTLHA
ncbi:MAG: tRNA-guanine transglycosylase, partial [Candidatus Bathyarchaeia archaeon]